MSHPFLTLIFLLCITNTHLLGTWFFQFWRLWGFCDVNEYVSQFFLDQDLALSTLAKAVNTDRFPASNSLPLCLLLFFLPLFMSFYNDFTLFPALFHLVMAKSKSCDQPTLRLLLLNYLSFFFFNYLSFLVVDRKIEVSRYTSSLKVF